MTTSLHLVLALLVPYMAQTQAHVLEVRAETQATCQAGFEWAENDAQDSPCSLAATVIAPCSPSGTWVIPSLNEGNHYNSPSPANNTVTDCYCSWAAYNLLNACTACQNMPDGLITWLSFKQNCGSHESNSTYFPSDIALAGNVSLPFYATIDPSSWQDGKFNVQQAQSFTNRSDVNPAIQSGNGTSLTPQPTSTPSQSSSPTGAIAGGVVGGIVILAIAALLAFWFIRRRRRSVSEDGMGIVKRSHGRSLSDMTQSSYPQPSDFPYSPMPSPGFTSIHTHESGPGTISRIGSIYTTPPHGNSSPTRGSTPAPSMDPSLRMSVTSQNISNIGFQPMAITPEIPMEEVARPFVVNQHTVSNNNVQLNRKGPINLQYDSPNSPPVNRAEEYFETSTETSRPQMNPPAYTPYSPGGRIPSDATTPSEEVAAALRDRNGHSHRPRPAQKGSFDTESPWTSTGSRVITTITPEGSGPSFGQMGSPVSPIRHVVNGSVISGPDDGPEIA